MRHLRPWKRSFFWLSVTAFLITLILFGIYSLQYDQQLRQTSVFAVCEALTASADNMFVSYAFNIVLFALYAAYLVRRERIDLGAMLRAFLHR